MLTDENGGGMVMPVTPMSGGSGFSNGNAFGDEGWWIILLFLLLGGRWGYGSDNNNGGGSMPYFVDSGVQRGFDQSAVMNGINSLTSDVCNGFSNVQQSLCNGFAGVNSTVSNGFANAEANDNSRQIANMQQAFSNQMAMNQGFNQLGSQFAECCCENRLASANLQNVIQTENCADRAAISDGIRDILTSNNANTQRILDTLCQDKIDAKNEKIADLERQLTMANLAASQGAQTSQILADNSRQTAVLEDYLNPVPRPAYVVQNPNCCQNNNGCGCGSF